MSNARVHTTPSSRLILSVAVVRPHQSCPRAYIYQCNMTLDLKVFFFMLHIQSSSTTMNAQPAARDHSIAGKKKSTVFHRNATERKCTMIFFHSYLNFSNTEYAARQSSHLSVCINVLHWFRKNIIQSLPSMLFRKNAFFHHFCCNLFEMVYYP